MNNWGPNGPPYEAIRLVGVLTRCPDAGAPRDPFSEDDMETFYSAFLQWVHDQGLDYGGVVGGLAGDKGENE